GLLTADVEALEARGVNVDSLANALAKEIGALPGVKKVFTRRSLAAAPATDPVAIVWRHSLPARLGWLAAGVAHPGFVFSDTKKAEHGTTHPETMRVPIAFVGMGLEARVDTSVVNTVDIGPTLAALLGIRPTERLDGRILDQVVRPDAKLSSRANARDPRP